MKSSAARPVAGLGPVAVFLLAVLLAGFGVTTLTRGWIWAAPYHDHVILGGRHLGHGAPHDGGQARAGGHGVPRHAHEGDELSRALDALRTVEPAAAVAADGERVVSTWSASASQSDPGIFTFAAAAAALFAGLVGLRGWRLLAAPGRQATGRRPAPLAPPPRPA